LFKKWALDYGVTLEATSALLRLLQPFHAGLPLDARTLLSTPFATQLNVKEIDVDLIIILALKTNCRNYTRAEC
jgi:hypothetical protein